jgi:hypothetical protein
LVPISKRSSALRGVLPTLVTIATSCGVSNGLTTVNGVPYDCPARMSEAECIRRGQASLISLEGPHPPVTLIELTCDAARCDEDEGAGQVIIHFADGTEEVIDIGFGHT